MTVPRMCNLNARLPSSKNGHFIANWINLPVGSASSASNRMPLLLMFRVLPNPKRSIRAPFNSEYSTSSEMGYRLRARRSLGSNSSKQTDRAGTATPDILASFHPLIITPSQCRSGVRSRQYHRSPVQSDQGARWYIHRNQRLEVEMAICCDTGMLARFVEWPLLSNIPSFWLTT